jgi:multidrug resistance efflux pump
VIDLSNLRTPAWQRVVSDLNRAAGDDQAFLPLLLASLGQVSGARQAALLTAPVGASDPGELEVAQLWPAAPAAPDMSAELLEAESVRSVASSAVSQATTRVYGLEAAGGLYGAESERGCVLCVPLGLGGDPGEPDRAGAVVSLLLDGRSRQALQTTIAVVELMAGFSHLAAARQQLARTRSAAASLDLATRLIASINTATSFRGAALQLVNDLCRHVKADRAALGWRRGLAGAAQAASGASLVADRDTAPVRVVAISDTEQVDARLAMVRRLAAAMDECLDQDQPVVFPLTDAAASADPVLARVVSRAHRELASGDAHLNVMSLPVRDGDDTLGVVTIESAAPGRSVDVRTVEVIQATLDLVGPVLRLRRSDDRPIPARAADLTRKIGAWAVGPRHTLWKLAGVAALAAAGVVTFVRVPYRVEAPVTLRPVERRVVAAPFDATVREVSPAKAGDRVARGDLLVRLDTSELELSAVEALGQLRQAQAQADEAIRRGEGAARQQAEARAEQARARLDLFRLRIEAAEIRAPIGGTILVGDLSDRVGARLSLGDPLFEIAPLDRMRVVARVDDRDIGLVVEAFEDGGITGSIATRAYPDRRFPLTVERIVPLAQAEGGRNAFQVYATLDGAAAWMRPEMEGLAKLEIGDRSLLWIGSRRVLDTLRLWLWW